MKHVTAFLILLNTLYITLTQTEPTTIPYAISQMAASYDKTNGLIWLIGGRISGSNYNSTKSLISFNTNNSAFNANVSGLPIYLDFQAQGWSQSDNILYMIGDDRLYFDIFNTETHLFTPSWNDVQVPNYKGGCLVYFNNYLIKTSYEEIVIYNISSHEWVKGVTSMIQQRIYHACAYDEKNEYVYQIGGSSAEDAQVALDSVEKLYVGDMNNINNYKCILLDDKLSAPRANTRAAVYRNAIYVMGGWYWNIATLTTYPRSIDIINLNNDYITTAIDTITGTQDPALQSLAGSVYIFGGYVNGEYIDLLQQQILQTIPTNAPTQTPTSSPTNLPTHSPTESPTAPSNSPTTSPTAPSNSPTTSPTAAPHASVSVHGIKYWVWIVMSIGIVFLGFCCFCIFKKKGYIVQKELTFYIDALTKAAKSNYAYYKVIKEKIKNELESGTEHDYGNRFALSVSNYISSISSNFNEATIVFILYSLVDSIWLIPAYFVPSVSISCNCNSKGQSISLIMFIIFLLIQICLFIRNNKCKNLFINLILCFILMTMTNAGVLTCYLQSNMIYAFNIIILGAIIAFMRFKKLYEHEHDDKIVFCGCCNCCGCNEETVDFDECIKEIVIKGDKKELENLAETLKEMEKEEYSLKKQNIGFILQMIAIEYNFEVSIIIVYSSIVSVFKIIYNDCIECKYNEGEMELRMILAGFFMILAVFIEFKTKCDRESKCDAIKDFFCGMIVTVSLLVTSQSRIVDCMMDHGKIWVMIISWGIVAVVIIYQIIKICPTQRVLENDELPHDQEEKTELLSDDYL